MRFTNYGFVQDIPEQGRPMLETTQWVRVNKQNYSLVDADNRVLAIVYTSYNEDDGDENLIWEVEIEGDEIGSYISLYSAKLAVQQAIRDWEKTQEKTAVHTKKTTRKKTTKKKATTKK